MTLTALQKRSLESYLYLRGKPPTFWRVLNFRPRGWIPFLCLALVSVLCFAVDLLLGMFGVGVTMGAVARIIAQARFTVEVWPVVEQATDWGKVEEFLRENGQPTSGGHASSSQESV